MTELQNRLPQKQKNHRNAAREHDTRMNERRQLGSGQKKKDKHIGRFKLFLQRNQCRARVMAFA